MLMCGEAVWCAVVRRSSVDNESCWFADGAISFPKEERLSVFNSATDQALLGLSPNHEDYTIRRLPIPDRLASLELCPAGYDIPSSWNPQTRTDSGSYAS